MSKPIGEIAAIEIPGKLLVSGMPGRVAVLASDGSVELVNGPANLHPVQARYLADLLLRAAAEAERLSAVAPQRGGLVSPSSDSRNPFR